jgi:hypothetical protein
MVTNVTVVRDGEEFLFASIDGTLFLGVSRPLVPGDEEAFQRLLDGDGNFMPLRIHRNFFDNAKFYNLDAVLWHETPAQ